MTKKAKKKKARKKSAPKPPSLSTKTGFRKIARVARPDPERVARLDATLAREYAWAKCALTHDDPFQLLIATILSAQTTDEVVNSVTPELFARYPDAAALANAQQGAVERIVHRTGFFRNKAKNIIGAARAVHEDFGGELPRDIATFVQIPGAARKTANVVLGTAFGIAEGVVVDTHVMRITRLWGFHRLDEPVKIERVLKELLPRKRWIDFSHQLIWHGRKICNARTPQCNECPMLPDCPEGQARAGL